MWDKIIGFTIKFPLIIVLIIITIILLILYFT